MSAERAITKIGLATIVAGRLLVVRKRGKSSFILPGGKPEHGENDLEALAREIEEELGCSFSQPQFEGRFEDRASEMKDTRVVVLLYSASLEGDPIPQSEIEELAWIAIQEPPNIDVAPSISNQIIPYFRRSQCRRNEDQITKKRSAKRLNCASK